MDHGEKDTGEGGAQADVVEPVAQRDRLCTARVEGRHHAQFPARRVPRGCAARGEAATSYDRFCKRYRQFTVSRNVVSRVGRKAGRNMEVDWSGPTMSLVDQASIWVTVLRLIP